MFPCTYDTEMQTSPTMLRIKYQNKNISAVRTNLIPSIRLIPTTEMIHKCNHLHYSELFCLMRTLGIQYWDSEFIEM